MGMDFDDAWGEDEAGRAPQTASAATPRTDESSEMLRIEQEKQKEHFFNSKKYPERYYQEKWNVEKRMAARRHAAKKARMKYERFKELGYYKTLDKMFFVFDIIRFIAAFVVLLCLPVFMFFQDQFRGLIIALVVQLITYPLWTRAIKRFIPIN